MLYFLKLAAHIITQNIYSRQFLITNGILYSKTKEYSIENTLRTGY